MNIEEEVEELIALYPEYVKLDIALVQKHLEDGMA